MTPCRLQAAAVLRLMYRTANSATFTATCIIGMNTQVLSGKISIKKNLSKMSKKPSSSYNMKPESPSFKPGGSSDAPLSQQMKQNSQKINDLVGELLQEHKRQPFKKKREGILLQLEKEMCEYMTIQEKFQEQENSMQSIIQELELDRLTWLDELQSKQNGTSEDITCTICLSPWDTVGSHRVVSLRCGHLYGNKCIRRVLSQSRTCPICKKRALYADIQKIYGSSIFPN